MKPLRCLVGLHDWRKNGKLTMTCQRCRESAARGPLPGSGPYIWSKEPAQKPGEPDYFIVMRDQNDDVVELDH